MASTEDRMKQQNSQQQHCGWGLNKACITYTLSPKALTASLRFRTRYSTEALSSGTPLTPMAHALKSEALHKLGKKACFEQQRGSEAADALSSLGWDT